MDTVNEKWSVNMEQKNHKMKYKTLENPAFTNFIKKRLHKLQRGSIILFQCPICGEAATVVCSVHDESVYAHCPCCGSYAKFEKERRKGF